MKRLNMIISIIFLAAADQVVKIIVNRNYMDLRFNITSWLGLHPHLNTDQMSILNNEFNLNVDHRILIIIEIVLFIALAFFYLYIERKYPSIQLVNGISIILLMAGILCSLMDLVFWGGSLDYILLFSKIIDLKDVYLFVGGIMFLVLSLVMAIKEYAKKEVKQL